MKIEVNGNRYEGFTGATATLRADALANTFSFNATSDGAADLPFGVGDACKIYVDGEKVLTGFIELMNVDGDAATHTIAFQGRSATADLLDSDIGGLSDVGLPISLKTVCERVIAHISGDDPVDTSIGALPFSLLGNPAKILVIDEANTEAPINLFFKRGDRISPEPGQNAFEFLDKLARKRQVMLVTNAEGNMVLRSFASVGGKSALDRLGTADGQIIHRVDDLNNNVLKYAMSFDQTGRFNKYTSSTQANPLTQAGQAHAFVLPTQTDDAFDQAIRKGRQKVLVSESPYGAKDNASRIAWEANVRRARGQTYGCTVHEFRDQAGKLWKEGSLLRVDDDYAKVHAAMFLNQVTFDQTNDGGSNTTLAFIDKDAYKLTLTQPQGVG